MNFNRADFPILKRTIQGKPLAYLDNAATSQKPIQVLDAITSFYTEHNANVHRGIHTLSEEATELFEKARLTVVNFIGAAVPEEVIFTSGTTDSINLVALWSRSFLKPGDTILTTEMEHHSNLVPWQEAAKATGATLKFAEINTEGEIPLDEFKKHLDTTVKIVAITHASNVLGTILPIKEIAKLAHEVGALVVVDGAQAVPHLQVNVQSLDCDFYAFSGHKMLGPMGIGVLYIKRKLLDTFNPVKFGGGMIDTVERLSSTFAVAPERYEAGTPNVEGAIGLAAAIDYLNAVGMANIRAHELELTKYALDKLGKLPDITILGPKDAEKRTGLVAFAHPQAHSHDIASILDTYGVAVRSGHHCTMPLHNKMQVAASTRASFYLYNTKEEIDVLIAGVQEALRILV